MINEEKETLESLLYDTASNLSKPVPILENLKDTILSKKFTKEKKENLLKLFEKAIESLVKLETFIKGLPTKG